MSRVLMRDILVPTFFADLYIRWKTLILQEKNLINKLYKIHR